MGAFLRVQKDKPVALPSERLTVSPSSRTRSAITRVAREISRCNEGRSSPAASARGQAHTAYSPGGH